MKRIVLVYPNTGGIFIGLRKKRPMPLGLLNAAVYLTASYDVKIFDQNLFFNWQQELSRLLTPETILVGIHSMAGLQILNALEISEFIKKISDIPVIWGGVLPSLIPEVVIQEKSIDYICAGEGEVTLLELVRAIDRKQDISRVKGLYYKEDNEIKFTGERAFIDLNELPFLPYHLLDLSEYNVSAVARIYKNKQKLSIETSRGCVQDCIFCYNPVLNKRKWRAQSARRVLERIEHLAKDYGVSYLDFVDDAFFTDLQRVEDIATGLIKRKHDIKWLLNGVDIHKLNQVDDAYLNLLERAGLVVLRMGAESGSVKTLNEMQKSTSVSDIININNRLKKTNMICYYYFTIGMKGETPDDLKESIDLMFRLLRDNPRARILSAFCLTPQPGTRLLQEAEKDGFTFPGALREWARLDGSTIITPWFTEKEKADLNFLFFASLFIDQKSKEIIESPLIRGLCNLYRPVARFRMRNLFFHVPLEYKIFELLKNWR